MIKVSIIALCYNHGKFLEEALKPLASLPPSVEVLVADDASSDQSRKILNQWEVAHPDWKFFYNEENLGNCRTFNKLLQQARGNWILDYATDDILIPDQLMNWLNFAESSGEVGFCYADAFLFTRKGARMQKFSAGRGESEFPEGRILTALFSSGLICPPAVLFSRKALLQIGGYNENLSYEDLDCWLRLARDFPVCRFAQPVVMYRQHADSMSARIYQGRNREHLQSTLKILEAVLNWPELKPAPKSLISFMRYHLRLCFFLQLPEEAEKLSGLLESAGFSRKPERWMKFLSGSFPVITRMYLRVREARQLWRELQSRTNPVDF